MFNKDIITEVSYQLGKDITAKLRAIDSNKVSHKKLQNVYFTPMMASKVSVPVLT